MENKIENLFFKNDLPKIGLAPMEGVLDPLLRSVITKYAHVDICSTEFIRVTDKVLPDHVFLKYAPELNHHSKTASGTPLLVQLLGGQPEWMALNAKKAIELGAYGIDINFGCPAKTVNRHDGGATLLKNPQRLYDTLTEIKKVLPPSTHISAKVRLGFSDKNNVFDIAKACSDAGVTWLTVHARTKEEGYKPPAHWEFIAKMKSASSIPIFANGDIWNLKSYKDCSKVSDCQNVMIGRGLLRNPLLAQEIKSDLEFDENYKIETLKKIITEYLAKAPFVYGEVAALGRIKQWVKICTYPEYPYFQDLFTKIKRLKNAKEIQKLL